jgi:hypothetical protein
MIGGDPMKALKLGGIDHCLHDLEDFRGREHHLGLAIPDDVLEFFDELFRARITGRGHGNCNAPGVNAPKKTGDEFQPRRIK